MECLPGPVLAVPVTDVDGDVAVLGFGVLVCRFVPRRKLRLAINGHELSAPRHEHRAEAPLLFGRNLELFLRVQNDRRGDPVVTVVNVDDVVRVRVHVLGLRALKEALNVLADLAQLLHLLEAGELLLVFRVARVRRDLTQLRDTYTSEKTALV